MPSPTDHNPLPDPRHPWHLAGPEGDPDAWADVMKIASRLRERYQGASLQLPEHTRSLVGRAAARLANSKEAVTKSHAQALWVVAMKHVLVDTLRRRSGAESTMDDEANELIDRFETATEPGLQVEEGLTELFSLDKSGPRFRLIVILRFTHGWEVPQIASLLGVSDAKVYSDIQFIRAWLKARLRS